MLLLLPFVCFMLCAGAIYYARLLRINELKPIVSVGLFALKVVVGFVFYYIYSYHYTLRNTSDALKYFDDALVLHHTLGTNSTHYMQMLTGWHDNSPELNTYYTQMYNWVKPWNYGLYNDNRVIIRANALCMLLSNGNYYVHIIVFNFVSYVGLLYMYNFFKNWLSKYLNPLLIVAAVFLTPSMLFWSSGVLKEPLLLLCMGLLLYNFYSLINTTKYSLAYLFNLMIVLLCAYALAHIKVYILPCLAVLMLLMSIEKYVVKYSLKLIFPVLIISTLLIITVLHYAPPQYNLLEILRQKQFDFNNMALSYKAGSYIAVPTFNGSIIGLVTMAPHAIYNTLFMPTLFHCNSAIMAINLIENWAIVAVCIYMLYYFDRPTKTLRYRLFASLMFVFLLATIIGISTPVIGAIVRYKIPLLPFVVVVLFSCISKYAPLIIIINSWETKLRS
jgi:hypothetical protein